MIMFDRSAIGSETVESNLQVDGRQGDIEIVASILQVGGRQVDSKTMCSS